MTIQIFKIMTIPTKYHKAVPLSTQLIFAVFSWKFHGKIPKSHVALII